MKTNFSKGIIGKALRHCIGAALLAPMLATVACDNLIYDELPPCESGVVLRFVYDYNMEFANAFSSKVDDLTVLVYDSEGKYLATYTEGKSMLSDENYRLTLDLQPGLYHIAAYGGIVGSRATFAFEEDPSEVHMHQRRLRLISDENALPGSRRASSDEYLRPLYFGSIEVSVPEPRDKGYVHATVPMIKDTNDFRLVLQQVNGQSLTCDDFDYEMLDDNILFDYDNSLLPTNGVIYNPWAQGDQTVGVNQAGDPWQATYAEFSTSRLIVREKPAESRAINGIKPGTTSVDDPRLRITRASDGSKVLDIPIIRYLELFKSEAYADMPVQEFLDRQSRWNIIFFLDSSGAWIDSYIEVNGWTVRLNEADL